MSVSNWVPWVRKVTLPVTGDSHRYQAERVATAPPCVGSPASAVNEVVSVSSSTPVDLAMIRGVRKLSPTPAADAEEEGVTRRAAQRPARVVAARARRPGAFGVRMWCVNVIWEAPWSVM
jgi:hypothetical protein